MAEDYPKLGEYRKPRHGTYNEYSNYKCRCDLCKAANNGYHSAKQSERREIWTESEREANRQINNENAKRRKEYQKQLESRNGVCDICKKTVRILHVDHDHETGEVRGFLCPSCNTGLGKLGDNIAGLQKAIEYLENKAPDLW